MHKCTEWKKSEQIFCQLFHSAMQLFISSPCPTNKYVYFYRFRTARLPSGLSFWEERDEDSTFLRRAPFFTSFRSIDFDSLFTLLFASFLTSLPTSFRTSCFASFLILSGRDCCLTAFRFVEVLISFLS